MTVPAGPEKYRKYTSCSNPLGTDNSSSLRKVTTPSAFSLFLTYFVSIKYCLKITHQIQKMQIHECCIYFVSIDISECNLTTKFD